MMSEDHHKPERFSMLAAVRHMGSFVWIVQINHC